MTLAEQIHAIWCETVGCNCIKEESAYRDLLANGERVEWCVTHRYTGSHLYGEECEYAYHRRPQTLCKFISKLLVDPPAEEE